MSSDQLKWHLLRKVTQIMLEKHSPEELYENPEFQSRLTHLLLSGKEGATAVRTILSQNLTTVGDACIVRGELCNDKFDFFLDSVYLRNLALRWTRFLQIELYFRYDANYTPDQLPEWMSVVRAQNSVEKLHLKYSGEVCRNVALVKACPNLAVLMCTPRVLVSLLEHVKAPFFSKLHTIETTEYYDWSLILAHMTKHPKQCPALETLEMHSDRLKLAELLKSIRKYSIPTVKTLNIETDTNCCTAIDFSTMAPICAAFPNLENASLTLYTDCKHPTPKLPVIRKLFGRFNPKIQFTVNYKLEHNFLFSNEELDRFEDHLETFLGNGRVLVDRDGFDLVDYSLATSYPNIKMKVKLEYIQWVDEVLTDYELELEYGGYDY